MYDLKPQARPYAKAAFLAAVEKDQINKDEDIVEYTKLARQISDKNNVLF